MTSPAFPMLFSPIDIGAVPIANRIVFAGHGSRFVDWHRHHLAPRQAEYLADRAKGGVGLIIQGSSMVHPTGMTAAGVNEVWTDDSIPSYQMVADAVHAEGSKIFGQLSHLGRQGNSFASHREMWAPSPIPDPASRSVPHAMDRRDIAEIIEAYRSGARRLAAAGFDGLEVYLAHGYLLCEFLSRFSNHRTDEYGGSFENRMRLPMQVMEAVRDEVGDDFAVGIRVSADEFVPDGLDPAESSAQVAYILERVQTDYVSVSQSNYASIDRMIPDMSYVRAPFAHYAKEIRQVTAGVPVFAVARLVTPEQCEELLAGEAADMVCLVRPLIADPELPNKSRDGRREEVRECISCNVGCRGGPHRGSPIACLVNPVVGFEKSWGIGKITTVDTPKRVVVVGGGPGGLKAAETAALRGHDVTLLEASAALGGQVLVAAAAMPYRDEFANSVRFLEAQLGRLGVEVRLNTRADTTMLAELAPDAVIVATGSKPGRPDIEGADLPHVRTAHQAITEGVEGRRIVVIDSGEADWKCLTTAEGLAAAGHDVRIVSPVPIGAEMDIFSKPPMLRRLRAAGVTWIELHTVTAIEAHRIRIREGLTGDESWLDGVDAVVTAWYGVADSDLLDQLRTDPSLTVHGIGDCLAPRRAIDAIWDGFRVGVEL
jgi:2,4-dienoyl-CoA reductase-like NADH-dependent reductase (Old Yellow Enzyme family)/NADPH-dependent 2,4-dienoyl-CoA reductase/sulfur reductase-like enzyme